VPEQFCHSGIPTNSAGTKSWRRRRNRGTDLLLQTAAIVAFQDYGQTGTIAFLGRHYDLPTALGRHQTYFLWGPKGYSRNYMIVLDDTMKSWSGFGNT
jgi:hypothetical protein